MHCNYEELTGKKCRPIIEPRGLSRTEAAAYIGISPSLFDEMVRDGGMPQPKVIKARRVWDKWTLDTAFSALPDKNTQAADEWEAAL
jgi:predicted DNA-binding transcriptional regulator AlpA